MLCIPVFLDRHEGRSGSFKAPRATDTRPNVVQPCDKARDREDNKTLPLDCCLQGCGEEAASQ
jgi:hypothetical protein